jgi:hypothetical protein
MPFDPNPKYKHPYHLIFVFPDAPLSFICLKSEEGQKSWQSMREHHQAIAKEKNIPYTKQS